MDSFYNYIESVINSIICKFIKPDLEVEYVTDLNENIIDNLIEYGIDGMIIDVDETIRFNSEAISDDISKWLDLVTSKLDIIALSDGYDREIKGKLKDKEIDYIGFGFKPFRPSFLFACYKLKKSPIKVAVVGDDLWADIHGGNKNYMMTIKVSGKRKLQ